MVFSCQLARDLHQVAFLTEYRYLKSPQYVIQATPSRASQAINFINGGWLEHYVRLKFHEAFAALDVPRSFIQGVKIRFANGDNYELDFLGELDGKLFWLECKTGDY